MVQRPKKVNLQTVVYESDWFINWIIETLLWNQFCVRFDSALLRVVFDKHFILLTVEWGVVTLRLVTCMRCPLTGACAHPCEHVFLFCKTVLMGIYLLSWQLFEEHLINSNCMNCFLRTKKMIWKLNESYGVWINLSSFYTIALYSSAKN